MVNELGAGRAMVVFDDQGQERPEPLAVYGFRQPVWREPTLCQEILVRSMAERESIHSRDVRTEFKAGAECHPSVCCVALGGQSENWRGFLYCDHPEVGKFDASMRRSLVELAGEFESRYLRLLSQHRVPHSTVDFEDAPDTAKLVKIAVRKMIGELRAERALVLWQPDAAKAEPEPIGLYGFQSEDIWKDPTLPEHLLSHLLAEGEPVYFADFHQAVQSQARRRCFPCLAGVPLDPGRPQSGLLYCDHSNSQGLEPDAIEKLSQWAERFQRRYRQLRQPALPASAEEVEGDLNLVLRRLKVLFALMVTNLVWLLFLRS